MAKEETRKKILKAAEELFSKSGYDGVPTKAIAELAGVTEMTLFNHFKNKELLYKTVVIDRYLAIRIESVFSELTYDDFEKDLTIISGSLIKNFLSNKSILMMRLKEKDSFHNDENFIMEKDPILKQIAPVFDKYAEKGIINGPGWDSAFIFTSAFKGMCHLCMLDGKEEQEIKKLIANFIRTICHGMICK